MEKRIQINFGEYEEMIRKEMEVERYQEELARRESIIESERITAKEQYETVKFELREMKAKAEIIDEVLKWLENEVDGNMVIGNSERADTMAYVYQGIKSITEMRMRMFYDKEFDGRNK